MPYGGERRASSKPRGLLSHPALCFGVPGVLVGFLLARWLAVGAGAPAKGGKARKAKKGGVKEGPTWSGPVPPSGEELKVGGLGEAPSYPSYFHLLRPPVLSLVLSF